MTSLTTTFQHHTGNTSQVNGREEKRKEKSKVQREREVGIRNKDTNDGRDEENDDDVKKSREKSGARGAA